MDARLFHEFLGQSMVGTITIAIGVIYLLLDHRVRANVGIGCFWVFAGIAVITTPLVAGQVDPHHVRVVERLHVLLEAGAVVSVCFYLTGLVATAEASPGARRLVTGTAWVGGIGAGLFAVLGMTLTATRLNDFSLALHSSHALARPGFWVFGSLWIGMTILFFAAWITLARQRLDAGERARAVCYAVAGPFATFATFLPVRLALVSFVVAVIISLVGVFRYFLVQGERAAFLSRFLSPQVADLVRLRGLAEVMQPQEIELSVVCLDFRGFTSYAEAVPSQAVIELISDYHEAIATAVAQYDGMVKDYAGDGILILVGAPIPRQDHAVAAVSLARAAMDSAREVTGRWATGPHPLGIGIGVASGRVTVGAIGDAARMEYTAVGTAVNVAARLCSAAEDGVILLDQCTAHAVDRAGCEERGELALKGMSVPVTVYATTQVGG